MADAFTELLGLILMETNSHNNDWGSQLNTAIFRELDRAAGNATGAIATTGGTSQLTSDEMIDPILRVTGTLTSNAVIEWAENDITGDVIQRANWFINDTDGNFTLTIKTPSGSGVDILRGETKMLRCDGTNVVDVGMPAYSQLAGLAEWMGTASGTNSYAIAANDFITQLSDGLELVAVFTNANTLAACTLNFASLGAKDIVHSDGTALGIGDITALSIKALRYRLSTDKWYMMDLSPSTIARLASNNAWTGTQSYADDVTFNGPVLSPQSSLTDAATIAWDMNETGPNVTVTLTASRTLGQPTNQKVGQRGTIEVVQNATGGWGLTLNAVFLAMGTPVVDKTASARTLFQYFVRATDNIEIWPVYKSGHESVRHFKEYDLGTLALGAQVTQAHLLGKYPSAVECYLQNVTSDVSYSTGRRVLVTTSPKDSDNDRGLEVSVDTTNIYVRVGASAPFLLGTSGANTALTASRWKLIARVYD